MSDERNIVIPVTAQVDEASSVKSIESFVKKAEPLLQNAFTVNSKQVIKDWNKYLKPMLDISKSIRAGVDKPLFPKINQSSLASLRMQQELSFRTRKKLGMPSNLKVYSSLNDVNSDISRLQKIQSTDFENRYDTKMINDELKFLEKKKLKFKQVEEEIAKTLSKNYTERERLNAKLKEEIRILDDLKARYQELSLKNRLSKGQKEEKQALPDQIKQQDAQVRKAQADLDKLTNTKKLSKFGKFLNRFNSYLNVRLLRNFFSSIEKGFSESLQGVAKASPEINASLSSITSQFAILSNSIVSMFTPLIKVVEPVLKTITQSIAKFAEGVTYLFAKLTKSSTYLKVNTEYLKEFNQEMNQLSFDKFEALSNGETTANMFEEVNISEASEDLKQRASEIATIIQAISVTIGVIGASKLLTWIKDGGIAKLKDGLSGVNTKILDISSSLAFIIAVKELIDEIKSATESWDSKSLVDKVRSICKIALYGLSAIAILLGTIMSSLGNVAWGAALKIGGIAALGSAVLLDSIGVFANGGIAEKGDLFVANDAGPELVYSGPNNASSIMNISQFKQAVVEGLYEWWSDAKYDLPEQSTSGFDGASVARSKSFIDEFNRRNSGMKIR